jgi:hypothetical protein
VLPDGDAVRLGAVEMFLSALILMVPFGASTRIVVQLHSSRRPATIIRFLFIVDLLSGLK